jgi:ABC-type phosphate/phosphonate transport system substrate-binding protein
MNRVASIGALCRRCLGIALGVLLGALVGSPVLAAEETIHMGFYQGARREMSRTDLRSAFQLWSQELAATFKVPIVVTFFEDIGSMRQAFERGEINAVSADAMALVRNFNIADLAEGYSVAMPASWNLLMLTGRESGIRSAADFLGRRLAIVEDDQAATTYLETVCLRQYGRECSKVFSDIQRLPNNNQAVMRLFFDKADVALVYRYGYELSREMNPQLEKKAGQVVFEVPFTGMFYSFFSSKVDPVLRARAVKLIPTLHTYPRGRQLLDIFKMDHLEVASPQELKPFLLLDQDWQALKAQVLRNPKGKKS